MPNGTIWTWLSPSPKKHGSKKKLKPCQKTSYTNSFIKRSKRIFASYSWRAFITQVLKTMPFLRPSPNFKCQFFSLPSLSLWHCECPNFRCNHLKWWLTLKCRFYSCSSIWILKARIGYILMFYARIGDVA